MKTYVGGQGKRKDNVETLTFPSPREYEVLRLIIKGFKNRQIADILKIHIQTVKNHNRSLFLKMRVVDRKSLKIKAKQLELI